jgi:hypothetical protein
MRVLAVVVFFAAVVACGRRATNDTGTEASATSKDSPESTKRDRSRTERRAFADTCLQYQLYYWKQAATERAIGKSPMPPDLTNYACGSLYSEPACGQAWPVDAAAIDRPRDARRIARACAAAYCPSLDASRLALCADAEVSDAELIAALVALDTQILAHELGDPTRAAQLAARHRLFRERTREGPPAPASNGQTLVVTLAADGTIILGSQVVDLAELGRRLAAASARDPDLALAVAADAGLPYADVVKVMTVAQQSGVKRVSLQTSK